MKKTVKRTAVLLTFALLLGAAAGCELRDASEEIGNEIAEETANVENTETETAGETSGRKTFEEILAAYREPVEADKENNTTAPAAEEKPSTGAAQEDTSEDASPSEPASDASSLSLVTADSVPGAGKTEAVSYDLYPKGLTQDEELFTERDLRQDADLTGAKALTVRDGSPILIEEEGVYVLSGTAANCTVTVDVDKSDKVQLVLNNVNVTNDDFPAIYVISADKVFITTAAGTENSLTVTGSFVKDSETGTNTDAVIYSKDDLVLNGTGSLTVTSYSGNGITSKDDLKATGGTWTIVSALDAIEANDSVCVCGGIFDISTNKDGLHCENDESLGFIWIGGGTWTIGAKSDGIQGTAYVQIDGGTFDINGSEGIEATYVQINGGTIVLYGSDDGINASRKSSAFTPTIEVNGGDLTVSVGQGDTDGLDANGNIYVNGGTIRVTASMSSFDYDGVAEFNGGTIIINGEEVDSIPQSMFGGPGGGFGGGRGGRGGRGDFGDFGGWGGFGG